MRVLITGASLGIGRATARRLAEPTSELALHYWQHEHDAAELRRELEPRCRATFLVRADLSEPAEIDRLAGAIEARWDGLEALVLNAGSYPRVQFREMTDAELTRCLATNLLGPARLARRLLPLLERAEQGRIVFVTSVLAFTGSTHGAHYAAAKAGVVGLAHSLALELAPRVRVNLVAPGAIDTAILAGDTPEVRANRASKIPMRRVGRPEEVAEAIAYLVSDASSYVTGTTLHVNGGTYPG
ncbi:MAG TPA: SDR family NAD(P)-dependent oxidoreductase [Thermoplasmata archaeon]|nr:SDR family NAD(P)-dependent oxidoreductase [Thermoplasmata archaeon]